MGVVGKDFWERLIVTVVLAAVSFGLTYLAGWDEPWALLVLAVLQGVKNVIAQSYGDVATSGFADSKLDQIVQAGLEDEPADGVDWDTEFDEVV